MFKRDKQQPDADSRDLAQRFNRFAVRQSDADPILGPRRRLTVSGRLTDLLATPPTDLAGAATPPGDGQEAAAQTIPPLAALAPVSVRAGEAASSVTAAIGGDDGGQSGEQPQPSLPTPTAATPEAVADELDDDPGSWLALQNAVGLTPAADRDAAAGEVWPARAAADSLASEPASAANVHASDPWALAAPDATSMADSWSAAVAEDRAAAHAAPDFWAAPATSLANAGNADPAADDERATSLPAPSDEDDEAAAPDPWMLPATNTESANGAPLTGWSLAADHAAADPYAFVDRPHDDWSAPAWRSEETAPATPLGDEDDYPILLRRPGNAAPANLTADEADGEEAPQPAASPFFDLRPLASEVAPQTEETAAPELFALPHDAEAEPAAGSFFTPPPHSAADAPPLRARAELWATPAAATALLHDDAPELPTRTASAWPSLDGFERNTPIAASAPSPLADSEPTAPEVQPTAAEQDLAPLVAGGEPPAAGFASFARDWPRESAAVSDAPLALAATADALAAAPQESAAPESAAAPASADPFAEPGEKVSALRYSVYNNQDDDASQHVSVAAGFASRVKRSWFRETPDPLAIGAAVAIAAAVGLVMFGLLFHHSSKPSAGTAAGAPSATAPIATASVAPTRSATVARPSVVAPPSAFSQPTSAPAVSVTPIVIPQQSRPAAAPSVAALATGPGAVAPVPTTIAIATPVPAPDIRAARSAPFLPPAAASAAGNSGLPSIVGNASTNPGGGAVSASAPPPAASAPIYSSGTGGSASSAGSAAYAPSYGGSSAAAVAASQPAAPPNVSAALSSAASSAARAAAAAGSRSSGTGAGH